MLEPRWYKVLNDLTGNRMRTLLIVLSMTVGLFAVGLIPSASSILSTGLARHLSAIHPASGTVYTIQPFDEDLIKSVRALPQVERADARHSFEAQIEISPGKWSQITIFALPDYVDIRVNQILPQAGAFPPPKHEILIERAALSVIDAQIGDTARLKLSNDTVRELRIAGTVQDPIQVPARFSGSAYGYVSTNTLEWLAEPVGFNELYIIPTHPEVKVWLQHMIELVKNRIKDSGYTVPVTTAFDPAELPMNRILQAILGVMGLLGVLSLFLSMFLVVSSVSALLAHQKRQIGVMKAIGGTSAQIFGMYLVMVFSYGVLALLTAVPLGVVGARVLSQILAGFFNFDLMVVEIPPQAIVIQVIVGIVLPVLASLFPFLSNLRVSAAEAMSTYALGKGRMGRNPIDRLLSGTNLWFTRRVPVRAILLSVRNTFRSQGRLALTLITLTLGAAIFIGVLSVRTSVSQTVEDLIHYVNFDVMLTFNRSYRADKIQQQALEVPGITKSDTLLQFAALRERPDGTETGPLRIFAPRIGDASLIRSPAISAGRWLTPEDENAVVIDSGILKNEPDLGVGDEVVLKINDKEHTFRIVGVSISSTFASFIYANYLYMARLTNRMGEADAILATTAAHDATAQEIGKAALQDHLEKSGVKISSASTISSIRTDTETFFNAVVALLLVMAILLALVGGLGLMGAVSMNVLERTREIGVLRAIGAPNRGVAQVFILEGVTIGVLSWVFGSVLAIPVGQGLGQAIGSAIMGVPLTFSYSMLGFWLWLIIVVFLSALASFIPARNASRLTVRQVLAYE